MLYLNLFERSHFLDLPYVSIYLSALNKIFRRYKHFSIKKVLVTLLVTLQRELPCVELEALPAVTEKSAVFWHVKLCSLGKMQCFGQNHIPLKG